MSSTHTVSASELLEISAAGKRCELVQGELKEMAPAGFNHGKYAMRISVSLYLQVRQTHLGEVYAAETGFLLEHNPDTVRAPDVAFVTAERAERVGDSTGYFPGAPDLAVEVVSPTDHYSEVEEKVGQWLTAGCRMVIVVNPRSKTAMVYRPDGSLKRLGAGDAIDGADVVPGWRLPLGEIFT